MGNIAKFFNNTFFLKFAFYEIKIFQFLTNFTKIIMVSQIVKLHLCSAPL